MLLSRGKTSLRPWSFLLLILGFEAQAVYIFGMHSKSTYEEEINERGKIVPPKVNPEARLAKFPRAHWNRCREGEPTGLTVAE